LTEAFTEALRAVGFVFPATVIGGNPTNLKPFDDGYFIRDSRGHIFHVRRVLNQPEVFKTPIDPDLDILDIIVSEHRRRELHGSIITISGEVYLIIRETYHLIPLPTPRYDPGSMDFKLLIDPLHRTVTISNDQAVHGMAMDTAYQPLRTFTQPNADLTPALVLLLREILFPFQITLDSPYRGQAAPRLVPGGPPGPLSVCSRLWASRSYALTTLPEPHQPLGRSGGDCHDRLLWPVSGLSPQRGMTGRIRILPSSSLHTPPHSGTYCGLVG
jgi:hypothetical protein